MLRCCPAGVVRSIVTLKARSLLSFVIVASGVVALKGRPTSFTLASPAKGALCVILQKISVSLPCSTAARSIAKTTNGGAISIVASCDDTQTGPLPTVATARTAVFHLRTCAFGAAFIGSTVSLAPAGMDAELAELTPGG